MRSIGPIVAKAGTENGKELLIADVRLLIARTRWLGASKAENVYGVTA
jgi:hypothetical protein